MSRSDWKANFHDILTQEASMTPKEWAEVFQILLIAISAFLGGIGGFLVSKQQAKSNAKKTDSEAKKQEADAAKELTETVLILMKPLREEISRLSERLDDTQKELCKTQDRLKVYVKGVRVLIAQMEKLEIAPEWMPPENNENENDKKTRDSKPSP